MLFSRPPLGRTGPGRKITIADDEVLAEATAVGATMYVAGASSAGHRLPLRRFAGHSPHRVRFHLGRGGAPRHAGSRSPLSFRSGCQPKAPPAPTSTGEDEAKAENADITTDDADVDDAHPPLLLVVVDTLGTDLTDTSAGSNNNQQMTGSDRWVSLTLHTLQGF